MTLSPNKLKRYSKVLEEIQLALTKTEETKIVLPTISVSAAYKDLWVLKSKFGWKKSVRFRKTPTALEIYVYPSELSVEVESPNPLTPTETLPTHIIQGEQTIREIVLQTLQAIKDGVNQIIYTDEHLTPEDKEKLSRAWTQTDLKVTRESNRVVLTRTSQAPIPS